MRSRVVPLTFILAACSIVYELLLAQTLGALLGNTLLRYNVTIGLYLAALGAGSLLASRARRADPGAALAAVEWPLALLGAAGPLLLFLWDATVFQASRALGLEFRGWAYQAAVYGFDHAVIVAVGVLSGFELPLLMRLAGEDQGPKALAVDYAGTLAGAALFPLVLLPGAGLLRTAALAGLANAACGVYLLARHRGRASTWLAYAGTLSAVAGLLAYGSPLERFVTSTFSLP